MRILFVSQYFFPETGATSNRVYSLVKYLKEKGGHDVTVISEKPNHPKGIFFEGFEKGWFNTSEYDGLQVLHTWVYTKPEKSFITRVFFYVTFMMSAVLGAYKLKGRYDLVIATSPPLFVGISGWLISKTKRAKFLFDVRDLWPEVAVAMGELNNPKAIQLAERVERFLYKNADLITTVTDSFAGDIRRISGNKEKVKVVMNGALTDHFDVDLNVKKFRAEKLFKNKFIVTYAGNIGLAQGLEHIGEAAEHLQQKGRTDVHFAIIGEGPRKKRLAEMVNEKELKNIDLLPRVPLEEAVKYMLASDALLVPLADDEIYKKYIPSKLFDGMAAGKPVLLSVEGEARHILEKAGAGIYYEAENGKQLSEKIEFLVDHPDERKKMGENGKEVANRYYSRTEQAKIMNDLISDLFRFSLHLH